MAVCIAIALGQDATVLKRERERDESADVEVADLNSPSSFLFLAAMPAAPSSVLAPSSSSDALCSQ